MLIEDYKLTIACSVGIIYGLFFKFGSDLRGKILSVVVSAVTIDVCLRMWKILTLPQMGYFKIINNAYF